MFNLRKFLTFLILLLLGVTTTLIILNKTAHAEGVDIVGNPPYPTLWDNSKLIIKQEGFLSHADSYRCMFAIRNNAGVDTATSIENGVDYGYGTIVYTLNYNFKGYDWYIKDIQCFGYWDDTVLESPLNTNTYHLNSISQMILTMVVH